MFPNFYVSYVWNAVPLTPKQKFKLALRNSIDPATIVLAAGAAGIEQWQDGFSGYGQGSKGYFKRFGASYADGVIGTMIGGAISCRQSFIRTRATFTRAPGASAQGRYMPFQLLLFAKAIMGTGSQTIPVCSATLHTAESRTFTTPRAIEMEPESPSHSSLGLPQAQSTLYSKSLFFERFQRKLMSQQPPSLSVPREHSGECAPVFQTVRAAEVTHPSAQPDLSDKTVSGLGMARLPLLCENANAIEGCRRFALRLAWLLIVYLSVMLPRLVGRREIWMVVAYFRYSLLAVATFPFIYYLIAIHCSWRFFRRGPVDFTQPLTSGDSFLPPVSILKPIRGWIPRPTKISPAFAGRITQLRTRLLR